jgi:CheY-like chemotaxis protein
MISGPSVVVVDAELTGGNGLSACAALKNHPLTRDTAVIVVSGRYERDHYDRAIAAGADAFLVKPFSPQRLNNLAVELGAEARTRATRVVRRTAAARARESTEAAAHVTPAERYDLPPELHYVAVPRAPRQGEAARSGRLAG